MDTYSAIFDIVKAIPAGKVMSYGGVARALGMPRGARLVGWALRTLPPDTAIPWQRVVNRFGMLSIVNPNMTASIQADRLREEGLTIVEDTGALKIDNPPWWDPEQPTLF